METGYCRFRARRAASFLSSSRPMTTADPSSIAAGRRPTQWGSETVSHDASVAGTAIGSAILAVLGRWGGESPWACPDPSLWATLTSDIGLDALADFVLHLRLVGPVTQDGVQREEWLEIPPWLMLDLLNRAESSAGVTGDVVAETTPSAGSPGSPARSAYPSGFPKWSNIIKDMFDGDERFADFSLPADDWIGYTELPGLLLRWVRSGDPVFFDLACHIGVDGSVLSEAEARPIHVEAVIRALENPFLRKLDPWVVPTLSLSAVIPGGDSPEVEQGLCRIASLLNKETVGLKIMRDFLMHISVAAQAATVSPLVHEAWAPMLYDTVMERGCRWDTMANAVRAYPIETWRNKAMRERIISMLATSQVPYGMEENLLRIAIIDTWPEEGVRYAVDAVRARWAAHLSREGSSLRDILPEAVVASYARLMPEDDALALYVPKGEESEERAEWIANLSQEQAAARRALTAAVMAGYSHLLTEDEALALCMSRDGRERVAGALASGAASPKYCAPHQAGVLAGVLAAPAARLPEDGRARE